MDNHQQILTNFNIFNYKIKKIWFMFDNLLEELWIGFVILLIL